MKVITNFSSAPSENDFNELLKQIFFLPIPLSNIVEYGYTYIRRNNNLYSIIESNENNIHIRELCTYNIQILPKNTTCFVYYKSKQSEVNKVIEEYIRRSFA